jgi:hypothetical protein
MGFALVHFYTLSERLLIAMSMDFNDNLLGQKRKYLQDSSCGTLKISHLQKRKIRTEVHSATVGDSPWAPHALCNSSRLARVQARTYGLILMRCHPRPSTMLHKISF